MTEQQKKTLRELGRNSTVIQKAFPELFQVYTRNSHYIEFSGRMIAEFDFTVVPYHVIDSIVDLLNSNSNEETTG